MEWTWILPHIPHWTDSTSTVSRILETCSFPKWRQNNEWLLWAIGWSVNGLLSLLPWLQAMSSLGTHRCGFSNCKCQSAQRICPSFVEDAKPASKGEPKDIKVDTWRLLAAAVAFHVRPGLAENTVTYWSGTYCKANRWGWDGGCSRGFQTGPSPRGGWDLSWPWIKRAIQLPFKFRVLLSLNGITPGPLSLSFCCWTHSQSFYFGYSVFQF